MRKLETEHKGSKTIDTEKLNDSTLVSSVAEKLGDIGLDVDDVEEDDDLTTEPVDDDDESTPDGEDTDDDQADEDEGDDDSTSKDQESENDDSDKPELPEAYVRCAVHQGWGRDEAIAFFDSHPKEALKTFGNIYNSTNKLSTHWAAAGRKAKEQEELGAGTPEKNTEDDPVAKLLKENDDLDPSVAAVLKVMHESNKTLRDEVAGLRRAPGRAVNTEYERARASADEAQERTVHGYFQNKSMELYSDYYGVLEPHMEPTDLTASQQKHRYTVLQKADMIMAGAAMQGIELKVDEALEQAHMLVTEPIREKMVVKRLKATAKTRKKSHLFRPSDSKKVSKAGINDNSDGKPKTKKEIETRAARRLAKTFSQR